MSVEGREKRGYRFGSNCWAAGWFHCWAERNAPRPSSIFFFFFFFMFLDYFISFSFVLQFDSNQFVKFSKIQENIPEQ
jgi:hypothetical protein